MAKYQMNNPQELPSDDATDWANYMLWGYSDRPHDHWVYPGGDPKRKRKYKYSNEKSIYIPNFIPQVDYLRGYKE